MIRVVHPGSRIRMLTFYPSRIPGSRRHRIPDPDPQHWYPPELLDTDSNVTAALELKKDTYFSYFNVFKRFFVNILYFLSKDDLTCFLVKCGILRLRG
jgi:hypothetical protein